MINFRELESKKNLLGFSGGVDSTALFFMLVESKIDFDIAIVDYQIRQESKLEVAYAYELAKKYHKKIYYHQAQKIESDFENQARKERYDFFENIIKEHGYENLILAHHLNDRLEWFLMQMIKGSGLNSLLGFDRIEKRAFYQIVRPLIELSKDEVFDFVKEHKFFIDSTNQDVKFLRNKIRHQYANALIRENKNGILRTFQYLAKEKKELYQDEILQLGDIFYFEKKQDLNNLYCIEKILKKLGYVISANQRDEIQKQGYSLGLANGYIIDCNDKFIFVMRDQKTKCAMTKEFKNFSREFGIPKRIRARVFYLLKQKIINKNQIIFD